MRKILGASLIALPFAAWLVLALVTAGWAVTGGVLLFVAAVAGCMFGGAVLLNG